MPALRDRADKRPSTSQRLGVRAGVLFACGTPRGLSSAAECRPRLDLAHQAALVIEDHGVAKNHVWSGYDALGRDRDPGAAGGKKEANHCGGNKDPIPLVAGLRWADWFHRGFQAERKRIIPICPPRRRTPWDQVKSGPPGAYGHGSLNRYGSAMAMPSVTKAWIRDRDIEIADPFPAQSACPNAPALGGFRYSTLRRKGPC